MVHYGKGSISVFQEIFALPFREEDWALGNNSMKFLDFSDIS